MTAHTRADRHYAPIAHSRVRCPPQLDVQLLERHAEGRRGSRDVAHRQRPRRLEQFPRDQQSAREVVRVPVAVAAGRLAVEVLALTFDAAVRSDGAAIRRLRAEAPLRGRLADPRWCRPIAWWQNCVLGEPLARFPTVDWLEPEDVVRDRWLELARLRAG